MRFIWPEFLWFLLAAPVLAALYLQALRQAERRATQFAGRGLEPAAPRRARGWGRHVLPATFLSGFALAILAVARPSAVVTLPTQQRTIILAIDVSLSMRATDVEPNRIVAAQAAARNFVQEQPEDVRIGIVTFAGTAVLAQPPTSRREDLVAAIDRLQLDRHTAIGSGIVISLAALFPDDGIDLEAMVLGGRSPRSGPGREPPKQARPEFRPVQTGSNTSSAIILLTDGRRTTGPDPLEAARMAAERGVRVFTVGFGTAQGGAVAVDGYSMYMMFDEESLKAIAEITKAEYFHAATAGELKKIYEGLSSRFVLQKEHTEITALFAAAAATLMLVAGALSLFWYNRVL